LPCHQSVQRHAAIVGGVGAVTPQYDELKSWQQNRARGLTVLGFRAMILAGGNPERLPGSTAAEELRRHLPLTEKYGEGPGAHPFYTWASEQAGLLGDPNGISQMPDRRDGRFIDGSRRAKPMGPKIAAAVKRRGRRFILTVS
jgi:glutathione peroxidase